MFIIHPCITITQTQEFSTFFSLVSLISFFFWLWLLRNFKQFPDFMSFLPYIFEQISLTNKQKKVWGRAFTYFMPLSQLMKLTLIFQYYLILCSYSDFINCLKNVIFHVIYLNWYPNKYYTLHYFLQYHRLPLLFEAYCTNCLIVQRNLWHHSRFSIPYISYKPEVRCWT